MITTTEPQRSQDALRFALREETRSDHADSEAAFDRFDVASRDGLRNFLSAQHIAIESLSEVYPDELPCGLNFDGILGELKSDICSLGGPGPLPTLAFSHMNHSLGVVYVLAGSHLGSKLLLQRVKNSAETQSVAAHAYLKNNHLPEVWKKFLSVASSQNWVDDRSAIVSSAKQTFTLFRQSADWVRREYV